MAPSTTHSSSPPPPTSPKPKGNSPEPEPEPLITPATPPPIVSDDPGVFIDMDMLEQNLELDEDDNHEFSMSMVWAYFQQAVATFDDMDAAYADKDLKELSKLGHFLKGSSAALGLKKVQASCELIQHYGELRDETADKDLSDEQALEKIESTLASVKVEYAEAEAWLKAYYEKIAPGVEPPEL